MALTKKDLLELEKRCVPFIKKAGHMMVDSLDNYGDLIYKDIRDVSSDVDRNVEHYLRKELSRAFPEAGFIVEEGDSKESPKYNFIIDPIEGTKYYIHKVPMFFTQIGLLYKRKPVMGICYNPLTGQLFTASQGNGARLNGKPLKPAKVTNPKKAILDYDFAKLEGASNLKLQIFELLAKNFYRVRMTAGFLHPYITTGGIDGIVAFQMERSRNPIKFLIDDAPKLIIIKEAGFTIKETVVNNVKLTLAASKEIVLYVEGLLKTLEI